MIAFTPTPEQTMLQRTARDFAAAHIAPLATRARKEGAPVDSWPWVEPMYAAGVALGLTKVFVPEAMGGLGGSCLDAVILLEELGAADVGVASDYFAANMTMPLMMLRGGTPEQAQTFLGQFTSHPAMVLAGAQSEPNVGGSELMMGGPDPAHGPKLRAHRDGDDYVLTGNKSAFITNALAASHYFIIARTDAAKPVMEGLTIFHIPAGTPGLSLGPRTDLIGWPLSAHAEVRIDGVRLPASARIGQEGGAGMIFASVPEMPVCLAACFIGLARAAYDYALAYARQRRSGGVPLIEHQAVALKLAQMASDLHAARLCVWDAAAACETDPFAAGTFKAPLAKARAVDVAIANASRCVEILGAYGVSREYEAGRYLADAWVGYACDFTRDILHLGVARFL